MTTYPSRFNPAKKYQRVLFPDNERHAHSHDFNDAQAIMAGRLRSATDVWMRDGAILDGASVLIDQEAGTVRISAGRVYAAGIVHDVAEAVLVIPMDQTLRLGIVVTETAVSYLDDPELKGQIPGTRTFGEPGADRLKVEAAWGWEGAVPPGSTFYGCTTIVSGEVLTQEAPVTIVDDRLARYDREANGHYVVSGWNVRALGYNAGDDTQHFAITAGVANIWGYKRDRLNDFRLVVPEEPDIYRIQAEPHLIPVDAGASVQIFLSHSPIDTVHSVTVMRERVVELTHGAFLGAVDALPDTAVAAIVEVRQGATVYTQGTDYTLNADAVDWSVVGQPEPAPGSTYEVTYRYLDTGAPADSDLSSVTVEDGVPGSLVIVDYSWALPRIDVIAADRVGELHYVKGESALLRPLAPRVQLDWLPLAYVTNKWGDTPAIKEVAPRAVHNTRLELHDTLLQDLIDLVAQERLRRDMDSRQPTTKRGVFVDPLHDDDMRDAGLPQSASIVDQTLQLPLAVSVDFRRLDAGIAEPLTDEWTDEVILAQPLATSSMLINPYQSFAPMPARARLDPAVDRWQETTTTRRSETVMLDSLQAFALQTSAGVDNATAVSVRAATVLRPIEVRFELSQFGHGETLTEVSFDGLVVAPRNVDQSPGPLVGDVHGEIEGVFTIPANIPVGTKPVLFRGSGGSEAVATFIGSGETVNFATTTTTTWVLPPPQDPLAQTFQLAAARHVTAVDLRFTAIGDRTNIVRVQIREVDLGLPTSRIVAEGDLDMTDVETGEWTNVPLNAPMPLARDQTYAIVILTNDAEHAVATAGLGDYDAAAERWVTQQPYVVGVLLSSSNAETWTAHQTHDLTFRLYGARFAAEVNADGGTRTLPTTQSVDLVDCTDLVVSVGIEEPSVATRALVKITRPGGEVIWAAPGQRLIFGEARTETIAIAVVLRGTATESAVAYPWVQIIQGSLEAEGDYISRAMPGGAPADPVNVVVTFETLLPAGSAVSVETGQDGNWTPMDLHSVTPIGDGWQERSFTLSDYDLADARVRLVLNGSPAARPELRQIRANVTADPINIITGQ